MKVDMNEVTSDLLRYNESSVYIVDGHTPFEADDMVGKHGLAWWQHSENRWYFREYGTENVRWVKFHQLGFCPLIGDQVLVRGAEVPVEYRMDRYGKLDTQQVRDRLITVTGTEWSRLNNKGEVKEWWKPRVWINGEVKSHQNPDETEQVRFTVFSPHQLDWMFPDESSLGDKDVPSRNLLFHEFHAVHALLSQASNRESYYEKDFHLIGEMLSDEAHRGGRCDEFDRFVEIFNSDSELGVIKKCK